MIFSNFDETLFCEKALHITIIFDLLPLRRGTDELFPIS